MLSAMTRVDTSGNSTSGSEYPIIPMIPKNVRSRTPNPIHITAHISTKCRTK
jgi:hypothetical protein